MPDKQYPDPGQQGPVYTGYTFKTAPKSYLISIGVEGSEVPPFEGKLVKTGPFTNREGIVDWINDEYKRLTGLGGTVTLHLNNAAIARTLEKIIGEAGLDLQSGRFTLKGSHARRQLPQSQKEGW